MLRNRFRDLIRGWSHDEYPALIERITQVETWTKRNQPLFADEQAIVDYMVEKQILLEP